MSLGPHTITLLEASTSTDEYGNESQGDWSNPTRTDIHGCSVQPARADEYTIDREAIVVRLRAFLPGVHDVKSTARAEYRGEQFYIDGVEPWDFPPLSHTDLLLRRVSG